MLNEELIEIIFLFYLVWVWEIYFFLFLCFRLILLKFRGLDFEKVVFIFCRFLYVMFFCIKIFLLRFWFVFYLIFNLLEKIGFLIIVLNLVVIFCVGYFRLVVIWMWDLIWISDDKDIVYFVFLYRILELVWKLFGINWYCFEIVSILYVGMLKEVEMLYLFVLMFWRVFLMMFLCLFFSWIVKMLVYFLVVFWLNILLMIMFFFGIEIFSLLIKLVNFLDLFFNLIVVL